MQRNTLKAKAFYAHILHQRLREVETRCGCCHRALIASIDSLVARVVNLLALAVEIWRDGYATELLEEFAKGAVGRPAHAHDMLACAALNNLGTQRMSLTREVEVDAYLALLPLLEVAHDAAPLTLATLLKGALIVRGVVRFEAEDLDARTRCLVHHDAGTHHARIVEYEHCARGQELCHIAEVTLGDGAVVVDKELR